jgi:hypothetical protein
MVSFALFIIPDYADSFMVIIWPIVIWGLTSLIHRDISKGASSTVIGLTFVLVFLSFNIAPPPYGMAIILAIPVILQELFYESLMKYVPDSLKTILEHGMVLIVTLAVVFFLIYSAFAAIVIFYPDDPKTAPNADFGYEYNQETRQIVVRHEGGQVLDNSNTEKLEVWVERNETVVRKVLWANQTGGLPINEQKSIVIQGVLPGDTVSVIWFSEWSDKEQVMARLSLN